MVSGSALLGSTQLVSGRTFLRREFKQRSLPWESWWPQPRYLASMECARAYEAVVSGSDQAKIQACEEGRFIRTIMCVVTDLLGFANFSDNLISGVRLKAWNNFRVSWWLGKTNHWWKVTVKVPSDWSTYERVQCEVHDTSFLTFCFYIKTLHFSRIWSRFWGKVLIYVQHKPT